MARPIPRCGSPYGGGARGGFSQAGRILGHDGHQTSLATGIVRHRNDPCGPREGAGGLHGDDHHYELRADGMSMSDIWIQIGGHVFKRTGNDKIEVPDAWVGLETVAGVVVESTKTNELGRFTFVKLKPGQYRLNARAVGMSLPQPRSVMVPSPTGEYDLTLS